MGLEYESEEVNEFDGKSLPDTIIRSDVKAARRIYFFNNLNRPEPDKYQWELCGLSPFGLIKKLTSKGEGSHIMEEETIGFIIAFPHVLTDATWGGGDRETNLYRKVYNTAQGRTPEEREFSLVRVGYGDKSPCTIGCPADIMAYAIESLRWAEAETVPEYLLKPKGRRLIPELWEAVHGIKAKNPSKMGMFFASDQQQKEVFEYEGDDEDIWLLE